MGGKPAAPAASPAPGDDQQLKDLWDWNFTNHQPTPEAIRKIEGLRSAAKAMKNAMVDMCPHSRERSLALTNLEQSLFYANAAIARNENVDIPPVDDKPEEDKALEAENNSSKPQEGDK